MSTKLVVPLQQNEGQCCRSGVSHQDTKSFVNVKWTVMSRSTKMLVLGLLKLTSAKEFIYSLNYSMVFLWKLIPLPFHSRLNSMDAGCVCHAVCSNNSPSFLTSGCNCDRSWRSVSSRTKQWLLKQPENAEIFASYDSPLVWTRIFPLLTLPTATLVAPCKLCVYSRILALMLSSCI